MKPIKLDYAFPPAGKSWSRGWFYWLLLILNCLMSLVGIMLVIHAVTVDKHDAWERAAEAGGAMIFLAVQFPVMVLSLLCSTPDAVLRGRASCLTLLSVVPIALGVVIFLIG
jgi:hypothetical protein